MFLRWPPCLVWRSLFGNRQLKGWKSSGWDVLFRAAPEIYWRSQWCFRPISLQQLLCLYIIQVAITAHIFQQLFEWVVHLKSDTSSRVKSEKKKKAWDRSWNPAYFHTWPIIGWGVCGKSLSDVVRWLDKHLFWSTLRPWVEPLLTSSTVKPHNCKTKVKGLTHKICTLCPALHLDNMLVQSKYLKDCSDF